MQTISRAHPAKRPKDPLSAKPPYLFRSLILITKPSFYQSTEPQILSLQTIPLPWSHERCHKEHTSCIPLCRNVSRYDDCWIKRLRSWLKSRESSAAYQIPLVCPSYRRCLLVHNDSKDQKIDFDTKAIVNMMPKYFVAKRLIPPRIHPLLLVGAVFYVSSAAFCVAPPSTLWALSLIAQ